MKLITETIHDTRCVIEESEGTKSMFIVGPYMVAEEKNRNGRVYTLPILESAVNSYVTNFVKRGRALGELGHPESPSLNLNAVSHSIKSLTFEGNVCMGKAKILSSTPMGKIAESLIKEGVTLGVSSRGMGTLKETNGINYVQPDFMIAAVDIVADPSAPGAFVNGIMEGKEWVWENGAIREVEIRNYKNSINKASRNDIEKTQIKVFEHFLSKLRNV